MNITREGNWITATRITGPHHNFLSLILTTRATSPEGVRIESLADGQVGQVGLRPGAVRRAVETGVAEANSELGTRFSVVGIRFLPTDTPRLDIYTQLAHRLVVETAQRGSTVAA